MLPWNFYQIVVCLIRRRSLSNIRLFLRAYFNPSSTGLLDLYESIKIGVAWSNRRKNQQTHKWSHERPWVHSIFKDKHLLHNPSWNGTESKPIIDQIRSLHPALVLEQAKVNVFNIFVTIS